MDKNQMKQGISKDLRKQIQTLKERSKLATEAGDYSHAFEINKEIMGLDEYGEAAAVAKNQNENLRLDPLLLRCALGVVVLYGGGWVLAFFH